MLRNVIPLPEWSPQGCELVVKYDLSLRQPAPELGQEHLDGGGRGERLEQARLAHEQKAQKFLLRRMVEITAGNFFGPAVERIRVSELAEAMFRDYRISVRRSAAIRIEQGAMREFGHKLTEAFNPFEALRP